jgi:hypothetical protein
MIVVWEDGETSEYYDLGEENALYQHYPWILLVLERAYMEGYRAGCNREDQ